MKERGTGHQFLLSKVDNAYKVGFTFSVVFITHYVFSREKI